MVQDMWQGLLVLYFLLYNSNARSLNYDDRSTLRDDTDTVESLQRDVRALAPLGYATEVEDLLSTSNTPKKNAADVKKHMKNASGKSDEGGYYKTYGSDAEGEKGYLKETYSKGDHGYKTLDTFHKQDGDKYGFEEHISYGKARGNQENGHHANSGSSNSKKKNDHEGAGTAVGSHYADTAEAHADAGEYSRYTDVGDGDHYTDDYNGHYEEISPESSSYDHGESYTAGNDDSSYETHGSYSIGKDSGEK